MKKLILTFLLAYAINTSQAQDLSQTNFRGTWVVESNVSAPKDQVIKFYNARLELIYEEFVNNRKVRYEKERIRKVLNKTLLMALNNEDKMKPGTFSVLLKSKKFETSKSNY